MAEEYYTYMVHCSDGTFYTGWTVDPERRVRAHNAGWGARYTKTRRPVRLVFLEKHLSRAEAMRRELAIKRMTHAAKLRLVARGSASGQDASCQSTSGKARA